MTSVGCSIPLDLMFEILLKLPAKSVLRFKYVSKSWCSIINSQQFIDAFMSLSLSRPRLLLVSNDYNDDQVLFFSSPHQNSSILSSSSSMLVTEKDSLTLPNSETYFNQICNSVRGFICFRQRDQFVVYNLTTRQIIHSTEKNYNCFNCSMYLGYDPNSNLYKVLRLMAVHRGSTFEHSVCTLRRQELSHSWRPIKANISSNYCYQNGVCINGVVYYQYGHRKIGCFDVGSEVLRFIETPGNLSLNIFSFVKKGKLANYMGNLAVFRYMAYGFRLWILDDVKNQVWSKKIHVIQHSTHSTFMHSSFSFKGITDSGEIVLVPGQFSDHFDILCCDMEKKMERRVTLEGLEKINSEDFSLLCSYVDNIVYL